MLSKLKLRYPFACVQEHRFADYASESWVHVLGHMPRERIGSGMDGDALFPDGQNGGWPFGSGGDDYSTPVAIVGGRAGNGGNGGILGGKWRPRR